MHKVAARLGMPVSVLRKTIDNQELSEWQEYEKYEIKEPSSMEMRLLYGLFKIGQILVGDKVDFKDFILKMDIDNVEENELSFDEKRKLVRSVWAARAAVGKIPEKLKKA